MDIINVEKRDPKSKAKQLRRAGIVPCSVYGGALPEAISIQMEQKEANLLLQTKREGSQIGLKLDGEVIPTQIKEATQNYENRNITHISFQALKAGQPVNSVAHILLANAETVPGVLEQMVYEVPYASLPKDMIDTVTLDLAGKPVGTTITLNDIPELADEKIVLQMPDDTVVLRIAEKKIVVEEESEESTEAAE